MRKCSSFMCVLTVLLAGGAEAQRPLPSLQKMGLASLGLSSFGAVQAWTDKTGGCKRFDQIYSNGKELCEVMWDDAFAYEPDDSKAYTMWWFEGGAPGQPDSELNPNNAIAATLNDSNGVGGGTIQVPATGDTCGLQYWHKQSVSPEPTSFTECHPWHSASCCSEGNFAGNKSVPITPKSLRDGYGAGYEWDRCGPISQACERFFVMEACFYECEPNAGKYRKYTDAQYDACKDASEGASVTLADGSPYTCVKGAWGGNDENQWQMYKMPIKAAFCDSWYRACAEDYFCGGGGYFTCANTYHADTAAEAAAAALKAKDEANKLPTYGVVLIIAASVVAGLFLFFLVVMYCKEKSGKPIFTDMAKQQEKQNPGVTMTSDSRA